MTPLRLLTRGLLAALVLLTLLGLPASPAGAERIGPGHPSSAGFSGYTTRAGHELGIARIPHGPPGICLDTGTRRWPTRPPRPTTLTDPVVGYLLSTRLDAARRDAVLAAALWWTVGHARGLNSEPERMATRLAEVRRESPAVHARILRTVRDLLDDAHRNAPPAQGYRASRPVLATDGPAGTLTGLGLTSARGQWVPGLVARVTLTGATFADGAATRTLRTATTPRTLSWRRDGASEVVARVRYERVPQHRYLRYRLGARYQRVAASAGLRVIATSARTAALSTPTLTTRVNRQRSLVGDVLVDAVTVSGTGGAPHDGAWQLLGPVAPDRRHTCVHARWSGAPVVAHGSFRVEGDGTVSVGRTRLRRGGCYTYRERLLASSRSTGTVWTRAGLVEETSLTGPRQPAVPGHPSVDTGAHPTRPTRPAPGVRRARIVVPGAGVRATLEGVAFHGPTLTAPRGRRSAGVWNGSVPLSSFVGTTLLAGHVSDHHDRPGVFHGLRRSRVGDRITTTDASGVVRRWRIVRVRTVDRRRLPRSLFTQGVPRRLVLITCTDRVTRPGGGFHYRKNLIVEAVPQ